MPLARHSVREKIFPILIRRAKTGWHESCKERVGKKKKSGTKNADTTTGEKNNIGGLT